MARSQSVPLRVLGLLILLVTACDSGGGALAGPTGTVPGLTSSDETLGGPAAAARPLADDLLYLAGREGEDVQIRVPEAAPPSNSCGPLVSAMLTLLPSSPGKVVTCRLEGANWSVLGFVETADSALRLAAVPIVVVYPEAVPDSRTEPWCVQQLSLVARRSDGRPITGRVGTCLVWVGDLATGEALDLWTQTTPDTEPREQGCLRVFLSDPRPALMKRLSSGLVR